MRRAPLRDRVRPAARCRAAALAAALALAVLAAAPAARAQTPLPPPYDYDEPVPAPRQAPPPRWQALSLGKPGHAYKIAAYANRDLARGELRGIRHLLVVFHGVKRDADHYYEEAARLLAANPAYASNTLIVAPRYVGSIDSGFPGVAAWRKSSWEEGGESVQAPGRPAPVSSFQVIDDLLRGLADRKRLPLLESIVLAGHSGGAQLVQRYAVLNNLDGALRRDGVAVRYVIANPSSYLYLGSERPRPGGQGYARYERGICPTYNQYKYGPDKLPAYARETDESRLFVRYADRDVTYLLGSADNNPEHRLLDKSCGAEAQGATRLARGLGYLRYEYLLASRGPRPVPLRRQGYEVAGVGHDSGRMFGSECGVRALLGEQARPDDKAASCQAIAPR